MFIAVAVYSLVNFSFVLSAMWLAMRPRNIQSLLPSRDAVGFEISTLVLAILTALVLINSPVLTPLVLVLVASLNRSAMVSALHRASRTDAKTGLPTLQAWTESADASLARARRAGIPVAILFCDLDHFKRVNDRYGHLTGDRVLVAVAHCLRSELREYDGLGRFGGEEFVVVLDGPDHNDAVDDAERLRLAVAVLTFPEQVSVTVSIGLAHHEQTDGAVDLSTALDQADSALRQAELSGRNQVRFGQQLRR